MPCNKRRKTPSLGKKYPSGKPIPSRLKKKFKKEIKKERRKRGK